MIIIYFAGHGIQQGQKVYLVPGSALLEDLDDLDRECVSLDDLLSTLRKHFDEPVRQKMGEAKAPVVPVPVVPGSCRDALQSQAALQGALAYEPNRDTAPRKYAILFSCSRTATASDGPGAGTAHSRRRSWIRSATCLLRG